MTFWCGSKTYYNNLWCGSIPTWYKLISIAWAQIPSEPLQHIVQLTSKGNMMLACAPNNPDYCNERPFPQIWVWVLLASLWDLCTKGLTTDISPACRFWPLLCHRPSDVWWRSHPLMSHLCLASGALCKLFVHFSLLVERQVPDTESQHVIQTARRDMTWNPWRGSQGYTCLVENHPMLLGISLNRQCVHWWK